MIPCTLVGLILAQSTDACDRFDRPDAADPGPAWVALQGAIGVSNFQAQCLAPHSLMTHAEARAPWAQTRLGVAFRIAPAELSYAALIAGCGSLTDCIFVKAQDADGSGDVDLVYFYRGENGQPWSAEYRQSIVVPRPEGRLHLRFEADGDVAVATLTDRDGGRPEEFRCAGLKAVAAGLGERLGIGGHGAVSLDDFSAGDGCLDPELELTVRGDCDGVLTLGAHGAHGEVAVLGGRPGSFLQSDPLRPCFGLTLALQRPALVCVLRRDRREYSLNANGVLCGLAVQAVDLSNCAVSPPVRL